MANCRMCKSPIQKGKAFHGEQYTSLSFCSEECYNAYLEQKKESKPKEKPPTDKHLALLKNYINELYDGDVSWPYMMKMIQHMKKEYEIDSKELYLTLKYATEYEGYVLNPAYGLGQYAKYIAPSQQFSRDVINNIKLAREMPEETIVIQSPRRQRRTIREEDWD